MVKKMIYLDEEMNMNLERVAHAQHKSVSELIRTAISRFFEDKEVCDLVELDKRMAEYLGNPSTAVRFRDVMDK